eukprot:CAMPEP_0204207138 /NCGR_PEP_ID=MMETSP0361-20130328/71554_1 /ASSEMBLY_ACC=CAM_ASM_000343 /TAXON_ID=268821 /ORGANISM="Scrippsiella Hangoei, Strain SHTV-5" /LENGTH=61 /DNA_ID=CAMNT_0051170677 /DNA_START=108 /DNA_END=291 /DNA_ORIENTATION=+
MNKGHAQRRTVPAWICKLMPFVLSRPSQARMWSCRAEKLAPVAAALDSPEAKSGNVSAHPP